MTKNNNNNTTKTWSAEDLLAIAKYNLECYIYDVISRKDMWFTLGINHKLTVAEVDKFTSLKSQVKNAK